MMFQVRIVFKNGEQFIRSVKSLEEIGEAIKLTGYGLDMVRTIHFGG